MQAYAEYCSLVCLPFWPCPLYPRHRPRMPLVIGKDPS
jgi:hypothetical protein